MTVTGTKLSQFDFSPSPPTATDVLVGVQKPTVAPHDFLYTVAQVASVIGPLLAGAPVNSIQFNNAGAFGGDANLNWYPSGTSPGTSHYGGVVDLLHGAIGGSGIIDTIILNVGEPGPLPPGFTPNEHRTGAMVLNINENIILSGSDSPARYGAAISMGYTNNSTAVAGNASFGSFYNWMTLNSNSTKDIGFTGANNNFLYNFAPVHVDSLDGLFFNVSNLAGNVDDCYAIVGFVENAHGTGFSVQGINLRAFVDGTANIPDLYGIQVTVGTTVSATCTTQRAITITTPSTPTATLTNNYGLEIQDQSGTGASVNNWNMWSAGNTSVNKFDGIIRLGPATTDASPTDGDLWYDGTHLNFRKGASTIVLT